MHVVPLFACVRKAAVHVNKTIFVDMYMCMEISSPHLKISWGGGGGGGGGEGGADRVRVAALNTARHLSC